ncbi:MAG: MCE family protein [Nocardioidaceae bacterium]|nr:MCE family protein [Nocardioidaceae bacterium]
MITSRTKKQLLAFVFITLVGVSYVGARYARLDKLVYDSSYQVKAHFADSGGIFAGAEVTYRGVKIGQVSKLELTRDGVDVVLSIDKSHKKIPADTIALVGNKSAVGEQYVELDPKTDSAPWLKDDSSIPTADTRIPISTTEFLTNTDRLVNSVPQGSLRTVVDELGTAFAGTGEDLGRIIDSSNEFIRAADQNFDVTTALIRDSNTVLRTQSDKGSAIRSFAQDLALFSGVVADNDVSLRALIDNGSATANELRTFLERNQVDLGSLINNLVTTGEVVVKHLDGIRQILVLYPYEVAAGYTVAAKTGDHYNARFGLILNQDPGICSKGYDPAERRTPFDRDQTKQKPMDEDAHCAESAKKTNARGAQNAPRAATGYRAPIATYDLSTGKTAWNDQASSDHVVYDGGAAELFGEDTWQSLLLQPTM